VIPLSVIRIPPNPIFHNLFFVRRAFGPAKFSITGLNTGGRSSTDIDIETVHTAMPTSAPTDYQMIGDGTSFVEVIGDGTSLVVVIVECTEGVTGSSQCRL
jgi:hypothetical protein